MAMTAASDILGWGSMVKWLVERQSASEVSTI